MSYAEQLREKFALFLQPLGVSPNTYKNYLSDLLHFFIWISSQNLTLTPENTPQIISSSTLVLYRDYLISHSPVATANRRLSTLRKFCQFAFSQNILPSDPSANLTNISQPLSPQEAILGRFRSLLKSEGASIVTIKNYLSDARHYMQFSPELNPNLAEYTAYLEKNFSPSTALRRISAVKKLVALLSQSPVYELPSDTPTSPKVTPAPDPAPTSPAPELVNLLGFPDTQSPQTHPVPQSPPSPRNTSRPSPFVIITILLSLLLVIVIILSYFLASLATPEIINPQSKFNPSNFPTSTLVSSTNFL